MEKIKLSRKELNKERVIKYALESFINNGIEATRVSDIAEKAELTERSVFRYFKTKSDLVLETALLFWKRTVEYVKNECELNISNSIPGIEKIRFVIAEYADLYFTARDRILFVQEAESYLYRSGKSGLVDNKPPARFSDSTGPLSKAIHDGIKDGTVIDDETVEYLYYNTYDSLLGIMQKLALEDYLNDEKEARTRIKLFVDTLTNMYARK